MVSDGGVTHGLNGHVCLLAANVAIGRPAPPVSRLKARHCAIQYRWNVDRPSNNCMEDAVAK